MHPFHLKPISVDNSALGCREPMDCRMATVGDSPQAKQAYHAACFIVLVAILKCPGVMRFTASV